MDLGGDKGSKLFFDFLKKKAVANKVTLGFTKMMVHLRKITLGFEVCLLIIFKIFFLPISQER